MGSRTKDRPEFFIAQHMGEKIRKKQVDFIALHIAVYYCTIVPDIGSNEEQPAQRRLTNIEEEPKVGSM